MIITSPVVKKFTDYRQQGFGRFILLLHHNGCHLTQQNTTYNDLLLFQNQNQSSFHIQNLENNDTK